MRAMAAAGGPLLAPPQRQTVGDFVGLCLLIDFSDAPATIAREEVERFCNQPGYTGFGNHGSVFDFFLDNSIGRCRYTNIVAPYYRALHPKTYYTDRTIPQPQRAYELINEALALHKAHGFDFSPLTADNQGFVYAMNVYYAGPVTNNWAEGLWPHSHHLGSAVPLRPGMSAFDYQFTAMGSELELGTFCHENGHMLCDYPDLYDYGYESSGVGGYCLMCAGNNVSEKNPIPISAYLKRLSGWARNVTPIEHGRSITLDAGSNDFAIYSRGGREYFLIENRRRSGRDASLPDEGLAIWHVDEDGDNSHEQMTTGSHYELSLEQADGLFQLERQRNQIGDAGDLFAGAARPLRRQHRARQQMVERHLVEPDHRPDLGRRPVDHLPLPAVGRGDAASHADADIDAEPRDPREQPGRHQRHDRHRRGADDLEPQGRRRHHAHLSRRPARHADHAVGNRHRAASEGTGRQRRRPEGDLRRDHAAGAGHAARAQRAGRVAADGAGPGARRHGTTEPVVAGVLVGRRRAGADRADRSRPARRSPMLRAAASSDRWPRRARPRSAASKCPWTSRTRGSAICG